MFPQGKTITELKQIAQAGGGFYLDAKGRTTTELVQIAHSAAKGHAKVTISGISTRTTTELVEISKAGNGCITLAG